MFFYLTHEVVLLKWWALASQRKQSSCLVSGVMEEQSASLQDRCDVRENSQLQWSQETRLRQESITGGDGPSDKEQCWVILQDQSQYSRPPHAVQYLQPAQRKSTMWCSLKERIKNGSLIRYLLKAQHEAVWNHIFHKNQSIGSKFSNLVFGPCPSKLWVTGMTFQPMTCILLPQRCINVLLLQMFT